LTKNNQVYRCNVCGNIVEVVHSGRGELVCCGQPMELLEAKKKDEGLEKHLPVVERTREGVKVKIGSEEHPMEEKHYIEWIEVTTDDNVLRKFLAPKDKPEAIFNIEAKDIKARAYCNIHGLWENA